MDGSTPNFRLWWDDELGIVRILWTTGVVCRLEDAQAVTTLVAAMGHGPVPLLTDDSGLSKMERAAREHFAQAEGVVSAVAVLARTAVARMIANFFIGMGHPSVPVRIFTDEQAAVTWLHGLGEPTSI